jgi:hypothetical protein
MENSGKPIRTCRQAGKQRERQAGRQTVRWMMDLQTDRHWKRQAERNTGRWMDRRRNR